ncbi:MAG: hypothetical protein WD823_12205 [Sulfuricaulis sp.]|uniref:hypothetical protein n=1 Tax=Sulfuricaulis sp. TaxID=2003553 RepID=UPI0034A38826
MTVRGARDRRAARQKTVASILLGLLVAVAIAVGAWRVGQRPGPTALLCPAEGAKAHIALLVDMTDPLSFTQGKALSGLVASFASGRRVKEGELLSVFALGSDLRKDSEPIFEKCNPGDGKDKGNFDDNPKLWAERFAKDYERPVLQLEEQLKAVRAAKQSPIMEMAQLMGLRFDHHGVKGPRRLIIVSDMLHNTADYSMYVEPPDFPALEKRPHFQKLRAKLPGVDVEILLLLNRPEIQNRRLTKFWEEYFKDAGAVLQGVDFAPG